jgi:hypothetical protein
VNLDLQLSALPLIVNALVDSSLLHVVVLVLFEPNLLVCQPFNF